jgi:hypothetical protein
MVFLGWKFALFHPRHLSLCTPYLYTLLAWGGIVLVEPDNFPSLEVVIALFIAISPLSLDFDLFIQRLKAGSLFVP